MKKSAAFFSRKIIPADSSFTRLLSPKRTLTRKLFFLFFLFAGVQLTAQSLTNGDPILTFTEPTEFNFGNITQGSVVRHNFQFKNTGRSPLLIIEVHGSCGCTVPYYPKEPIPPGKTGEIGFLFNSTGKWGMQDKTLTVQSNGSLVPIILHMKGGVLNGDTALLFTKFILRNDTFPATAWHDRPLDHFNQSGAFTIQLDTVPLCSTLNVRCFFRNNGLTPMQVTDGAEEKNNYPATYIEPASASVSCQEKWIPPGETGYVDISLFASANGRVYNRVSVSYRMQTDDRTLSSEITFEGFVLDRELPVMKFDTTRYVFGKMKPAEEFTHAWSFTNTGKTPLIITKVYNSYGSPPASVEYPEAPVPPGGTGMIIVHFPLEGKTGYVDKTVTVESNSAHGRVVLQLAGEIIPAD